MMKPRFRFIGLLAIPPVGWSYLPFDATS